MNETQRSQSDRSANIESVYPLSPMQEGMLFHTLLAPSSGIYLMQNRYRLEGEIDPALFQRGWELVAARHSSLRTCFVWKSQKRTLQVVYRSVDLPFEVHDWRTLSEEAQEARLARELGAELEAGFDLGKAPLTRFRLIRLGERTYEFVHSFHHILLDEWCTSLLMMDFLAHYETLLRGEVPQFPRPRPYRDYIDWLGKQDPAASEAFWREHLRGFEQPTPLGLEERAAAEMSIDDLTIRLDATSTAALSALLQRHRLTLNTIVQGAWALLLAHYSGEREVLFGVTVAGRPPELPDVESIVGLFINTLPLRVDVSPAQELVPWLTALLEQNLRIRQYEHTPLVDIQRWGDIARGQSLFHSLFVFENAPIDPALRHGRIVFRVQDVRDRVHTNYPVTVMSWPDSELPLKISYDRSRISPEAAARMLGHLRTILEGMAKNAQRPCRLGELSMLTATEERQALAEWNESPKTETDFSSYAARFQAQVARTPDAVAVRCGNMQRTYAELNRDANRLAHALIARGVGPEHRVALIEERGIELLTMILAVFKAGAAYVPIEPGYPAERIAHILKLAQPRAVLTRDASREATDFSDADPPLRGGADHLAYVIYTSGSTGVPKGAMVERRGMLNNMLSKFPRLGFAPGDVIAQTASPCFDISVWQFLTALLFGGVVDILDDETVRDPARLLECVERRGVTVLEVVPAVLQGMLDSARELATPPTLASLRWILPTGEALPPSLVRDWLARYPRVPLMNAYGPAECSDDVALHPLRSAPHPDETQVPIGRAVDHLRLYVLDAFARPMPVGVAGEIYVGGIGVGRGYLGDPRRTAAVFLPDPFEAKPGRRIYRTGDLGRYRPDGTIEFVGRSDHQVKIRGFRIELGEIEARLAEHPDVDAAAVLAREDRPGMKRLVAYVVAPADTELRTWLEERLPAYMVPSVFMLLPALPRTSNGKLDRRALPSPDPGTMTARIAPRTETEKLLAGIWSEVLGVTEIGVDDSFFDLGGHSLLLTQVLARARRTFEVEPSLRALFETPTVAAQARAIDAVRGRAGAPPAPALVAQPRIGELLLSFAQERLWFLADLEPAAAAYNVPAALRLGGVLDVARLERAFAAVIRRHESLRTRFEDRDGRPHMLIEAELPFRLLVADLRALPEDERDAELRRRLEEQAGGAFDLTRGPLLRGAVFRIGEREHVLFVCVHHIVSDGWSMNVLLSEVTELYAAETEGRAAALTPLPIQYADYARWQRTWLDGAAIDPQLAYWRQRLQGAPPVLELPTDRPRPPLRSQRGARWSFTLPEPLTTSLRTLARQHGTTNFTLLVAAFATFLGRYARSEDVCIGTPIANRTRVELEGLIGFFVNTLVLRTDLGGNPRFVDLLAKVREEVQNAQAHQDLPFERLVQALRPARDLRHTPLFQVMFSLQELPRRAQTVSGLTLEPLDVDAGSAQFDLSLHMVLDGDELSGAFEYSTDLFEERTIRRMAGELHTLLEGIAQQPTSSLSALPLPEPPAALEAPDPHPPEPLPARNIDIEKELATLWAAALGRERVEPHDNFFELGGDSILCLQIVARAKQAGVRITTRQMFQHPTLSALAAVATLVSDASDTDQGIVVGDAPLTPIQQRFFERELPHPHHWNQALMLTLSEPLVRSALERAVQALVEHHDALRLRYLRHDGTWRQTHTPPDSLAVVHESDLSALPESEQTNVLAQHASRWQATLNLGAGPLLRAIVFHFGAERPGRLLLIAHHLVVDGVSWRVLLEDLATAYEQARRGDLVALPEKTASFKQWAEHLQSAAQTSSALEEEAKHWLGLPWDRVAAIPIEFPAGSRNESEMATCSVALDANDTRALLEDVPAAYRTRIEEVLLTALALALRQWAHGVVAVDVEGHGREELDETSPDVSRTVGWFTSVYPVVLDIAPDAGPGPALVAVKEQLRRIPRRGLPFGVIRELGTGHTAAELRRLPTSAVAFNYLGQWDHVVGAGARFSLASESPGAEHDPRGPLPYELEIDAAVHGKRLEATWRYSARRYRAETVTMVAELWRKALQDLIAHCLSPDAGGVTPADFPHVQLAAQELDALLEQMD